MLGSMLWRTLAALLSAATTLVGDVSPAVATDAVLRFLRNGQPLRNLELSELRSACVERAVEVDDPYHLRPKRFLACPLREVMALGFGASWSEDPGRNYFLRARDAYTRPASAARTMRIGG